jgi:hypothetical protein
MGRVGVGAIPATETGGLCRMATKEEFLDVIDGDPSM